MKIPTLKQPAVTAIGAIITLILLSLFAFGSSLAAITRGYASEDTGLKPGMLVQLTSQSDSDQPYVERATSDEPSRIIGVATTPDESLVTIANGTEEVYVETEGEVSAYVTNLDGDIVKGDLLAVSPLKGILTKASDSSTVVIGIALENFSSGKQKESHTITTKDGDKAVDIAKIRINLDRKAGGEQRAEADSSLERLGRSITGKDVGEIRIVVALIIFFIVLVAEGSILYGAVSSSITALGRNPLAKKIIVKELVRVVLIAIVVLGVGLGAVYGVMWV